MKQYLDNGSKSIVPQKHPLALDQMAFLKRKFSSDS